MNIYNQQIIDMKTLDEYTTLNESESSSRDSNNLKPTLKVVITNRVGDIFKEVIYKDVTLIDGLSGLDELNYDSNDRVDLEFKLESDRVDDIDA